jgi:hypothetical protein
MKILKSISIAIIALGMVTACEKSTNEVKPDLSVDSMQSSRTSEKPAWGSSENPGGKMVTVPFKSKFFTEQEGDIDMSVCEGDFIGLNTQVGGGNATHLGKFTTVMTFCMNFDDSDPDNFAKYWGVDGKFIAANGDELWFTVSGQVILYPPGTDPFYLAYFDDEFEFLGGTGRFLRASGTGHTNSFTNFAHTDHNWTGMLILPKGN